MTAHKTFGERSSSPARPYDVVLFGAAGFVGRQAVAYFARVAAQQGVRWALAGRTREKLEAAKAEAGAAPGVDVLVADGRDAEAVDGVAARTRVLLNTAGPFALYGDAVVSACVRRRTDYVDITGETVWMRALVDRHHAEAASSGTRIVPACGFDSVPSDLGVFLAVRHLQQTSGAPCRQAKAFFQMRGGLNGGTIASALNAARSTSAVQADDPFLLNPDGGHSPEEVATNRDPRRPVFDPDVGAWVGPFAMGPVNTRVVRRSASLFAQRGEPYGPHFGYQEYAKYEGPAARARAGLTTGALRLVDRALRRQTSRRLLGALLPKPGAGPSPAQIERGWFRCEVVALTDDGRRARVLIAHRGDASNRATVRFVCESALCLALDPDPRPGEPRPGGVLTPATAFGESLAHRLRRAGVGLEVGV